MHVDAAGHVIACAKTGRKKLSSFRAKMQIETIEIICEDGVRLSGELLIPPSPKAVVQFNAGTAAQRGVYRAFAQYLVEHGYLCCLYDYRGFGRSKKGTLKGSEIRYVDIGTKDLPAVKSWLQARYPDLPLLMVAHSAGGQQIGFMPDVEGIAGVVTFGVSAAHLRAMPTHYRAQSLLFFYGITPVSNALLGYVAAARLGLMEDLPKRLATEWRDWCSVPDYFFDPKFYGVTVPKGHFQDFTFPWHNVHASDDAISTPTNIRNFWKHIQSTAPITFDVLHPAEVGLHRIDHFGYFKRALKERLWADVVRCLDEMAGA